MAAVAHRAEANERGARQRQLLWSGMLQTAHGPVQCIVAELSAGGARLTTGADLVAGQAVTLFITGIGMFRGTVAWAEAGMVGVAFAATTGASAA
jgi:hypothetical protein